MKNIRITFMGLFAPPTAARLKEARTVETYTLKKPVTTAGGEKITEIRMDFDSMDNNDLERCERQARQLLGKKRSMVIPETSKLYAACVAAKASGLTVEDIRSLAINDYTQLCMKVQNFLLDGESEEETETEM